MTAKRKEENSKGPRSFGGLWAPPKSRPKLVYPGKEKGEWDILSFFYTRRAQDARCGTKVFVFESLDSYCMRVSRTHTIKWFLFLSVGTYGARPHKLVHAIVSVI